MAGVQYKVELTSDISGALNPAFVDFATDGTGASAQQVAAQVCLYLASTINQMGEANVKIQAVTARTLPGGSFVPVPDFETEFNATKGAFTAELDNVAINSWTGYPYLIASDTVGGSSGRGDSLCVNTRAAAAGRSGRGRHFLPFLARQAVGSDGLINSALVTYVQRCYAFAFQGAGTTPVDELNPVVFSPTHGTISPVNFVVVNNIPSRLRSRTK